MTVLATRRGLLAGALAGAALPSLARADGSPPASPPRATQKVVLRGRALAVTPDGDRAVIAHDRRSTVALVVPGSADGHVVDVGGHPVAVAVSPAGDVAAVTTAFWREPGLAIVDLAAATRRERIDVGPAPFAVAFTAGGERLVVSGGEQEGTLHVLDVPSLAVQARHDVGTVPRGVAPEADGERAWVALNGRDEVVLVDLRSGRVARSLPTPALPDKLALSPDGSRLLVTHGGRDSQNVSEIDTSSGRVRAHLAGPLPSAVAWTAGGVGLAAVGGGAEIAVLGSDRRLPVAAAPRGLAVAGGRAFTVSALTGVVSEVRP